MDSKKVTVAGVITAVLSMAGFLWSQWKTVGPFVEVHPGVCLLVLGAVVGVVVLVLMQRRAAQRQVAARVRRARPRREEDSHVDDDPAGESAVKTEDGGSEEGFGG